MGICLRMVVFLISIPFETGLVGAQTPAAVSSSYETAARRESPAFRRLLRRSAASSSFRSTHGGDWSCASCHTANPLAAGKHAKTGKAIAPLAPAANPERFTEPCHRREVVQAQLQRRHRPRVHRAGKGRRAGVPDATETLGARHEPQARRWIFDATAWIVGIAVAAALVADAMAGERKVSAGHQRRVADRMRQLPRGLSAATALGAILAHDHEGARPAFRRRRQRRHRR